MVAAADVGATEAEVAAAAAAVVGRALMALRTCEVVWSQFGATIRNEWLPASSKSQEQARVRWSQANTS